MTNTCVTTKCNSLLDQVTQILLPESLVNFLNTQIINARFVFINLWSFVHFGSGVLAFFILTKFFKNIKQALVMWLVINIIFEIFEFSLGASGLYPGLFLEEFVDIAWDIVFSMAGFVTMIFVSGADFK